MIEEIRTKLFAEQDLTYQAFQSKLMPTVDKTTVIGVRTPILRAIAKEYAKQDMSKFLSDLPHLYYEENNLHGFILSLEKDFSVAIERMEVFLPYINNWATSDTTHPTCFAKHKKELLPHIETWLCSSHVYTVRYGIDMLMTHFLDKDFDKCYLERVATIRSEEYYINMMIAWYFATALAKQWYATIPFIEERRLSPWVHNKTIQKAIESYRITDEQKTYLRTLK